MPDEEALPFGLSFETIAMLIAMAIMVLILLGNPQVIKNILSTVGGNP